MYTFLSYHINSLNDVKALAESKDADGFPFNLNQTNGDGSTLLHSAASVSDSDTVKYLAELKDDNGQPRITNLNQTNNWGQTPLDCAARCQHNYTINYLKDNHGYLLVDINKTNIMQYYSANPYKA